MKHDDSPSKSSILPRRPPMRLNVWPLDTERDYERARDVVDTLILRANLSPSENARMEIFLTLMEAYESEHHSIDVAETGPIDLLKSLLEEHNMSASDLGRLLGSRALGSLILSGKRELSKTHIRKLADHFSLDPCAFF